MRPSHLIFYRDVNSSITRDSTQTRLIQRQAWWLSRTHFTWLFIPIGAAQWTCILWPCESTTFCLMPNKSTSMLQFFHLPEKWSSQNRTKKRLTSWLARSWWIMRKSTTTTCRMDWMWVTLCTRTDSRCIYWKTRSLAKLSISIPLTRWPGGRKL